MDISSDARPKIDTKKYLVKFSSLLEAKSPEAMSEEDIIELIDLIPLIKLIEPGHTEIIPSIPSGCWTREKVIAVIKKRPFALKYVPNHFLDENTVNLAVTLEGLVLEFVPEHLKTIELVQKALEYSKGMALEFVPEHLKTIELVQKALEYSKGMALRFVPEHLKTIELVQKALEYNGMALEFVPEHLKTIELVQKALEYNGMALEFVPEHLKTIELVQKALEYSKGMALRFVPEHLKTIELVQKALEYSNGIAFQYTSKSEALNENFMLESFNRYPHIFPLIHESYLNNDDLNVRILKEVFKKNVKSFLSHAPDKLTCNPNLLIRLAVLGYEDVFKYALHHMERVGFNILNEQHQDFIVEGVIKEESHFILLPKTWKENKVFMRKMIKVNSHSYSLMSEAIRIDVNNILCASEQLRNNTSLMLQVLPLDEETFDSAITDSLKNNEQFMLEAIKINVNALRSASELLLSNYHFMIKAVAINGEALLYASKENLLTNIDFILHAIKEGKIDPELNCKNSLIPEEMGKQLVDKIQSEHLDKPLITKILGIISQQLVIQLLTMDATYFSYLPIRLKTDYDFLFKAVQANAELLLPLKTEQKLSIKFIKGLFEYDKSLLESHIQNIPLSVLTKEFLFTSLYESKLAVLSKIEKKLNSFDEDELKEMIRAVFMQRGLSLRDVPVTYLHPKLVDAAIDKNGLDLQFVPKEYQTTAIIEAALKQNKNSSQYIHPDFISPYRSSEHERYFSMVQKNKDIFCRIPEVLQTDMDFLLRVFKEVFKEDQKDFFAHANRKVNLNTELKLSLSQVSQERNNSSGLASLSMFSTVPEEGDKKRKESIDPFLEYNKK